MIRVDLEIEINRPSGEVFVYVTDLERLGEWQENLISATLESEPPLRAGSRIREVRSGPFGRRMEALVEVAEYAPPTAFALRIVEGPVPVDGALEFEDIGGATRLLFAAEGEPRGAMRLMQPLLAAGLRRQFTADYRRLKENLEAGRGAAESS